MEKHLIKQILLEQREEIDGLFRERIVDRERGRAAKKMLDRFDTREKDSADYQQVLLDTCRRNGWSEPSFRFEEWGDSHKPIYTCTASLVIHRQQRSAIGIGAAKKAAKRVAARELLRTVSHIT
jgi:dsRNA-specific ribonuclease